jgi:hypothetical protein
MGRIPNAVSEETRNRIKTLGVEFPYCKELSEYFPMGYPNLENPRWWSCLTPENVHQILQLFPALERLVFMPHRRIRAEGSHCFRAKLRFVELAL